MPRTSLHPKDAVPVELWEPPECLEEAIGRVKEPEDVRVGRISVRGCPQVLTQYVSALKELASKKVRKRSWLGIFEMGLLRLNALDCVDEWTEAKQLTLDTYPGIQRSVLYNPMDYPLSVDPLVHPTQRADASVFPWHKEQLEELEEVLSVPQADLARLTVVAGFSCATSGEIVPDEMIRACNMELDRFTDTMHRGLLRALDSIEFMQGS